MWIKRPFSLLRRTCDLLLWILVLRPFCNVVVVALNLASSSSPLDASTSTSTANTESSRGGVVTIAVCTGPDCRVDGSSACLKSFQECAAALNNNINKQKQNNQQSSILRVTGRSCVGPCGDGPCVMVVDEKSYVVKAQPSKKSISLAPPDLFASNPRGWYQVRTPEQVQEVLEIACQAAEIDTPPLVPSQLPTTTYHSIIASSTRSWYDRPRNERKFLQRLMQVTVLLGLAQYDDNSIGNVQYGIAGGLLLLSTFIMKENIWNSIIFAKRRRKTQK
jgi:hypothetical protein